MKELAIFGGEATVAPGMTKSWPPITQDDRDAVNAVFDSNIFHGTAAPQATALQQEFADYLGAKYCLVTNSGTSALHMAIASLGIGPGDEVIVPAFTFWSTAAAVLHHNAIPVFVDIEDDAFCLDPAKIEAAITERTKAILPVHIHGMPADLVKIMEIAKKHNLYVIGDACQAHGAAVNGKKVGTIEDTTGFSTNRSKNLSSGEGGFFVTNNDEAYAIAKRLREFGEVIVPNSDRVYNSFGLGWNYRAHEFVNAFCRSQLRHLAENNAKRKEYAEYLTSELANIPGLRGPYTPPGRDPVYFSYIVEFKPEELGLDATMDEYKKAMEMIFAKEGVRFGQWQRTPVPAQDVFKAKQGYGKGCPWNCKHYNREITYNGDDFPVTQKFIASHTYLGGVYPPNDMNLMKLFVESFKKVTSQPDKIMKVIEANRKGETL